MSIEISKPFGSYVVEERLPRTEDAQSFLFRLPYVIEGTNKTQEMRHGPWKYLEHQRVIDDKAGVDGLRLHRQREMAAFCRSIEAELRRQGQRLYEKQGQRLLVRGPHRKDSGL